MVLQILRCLDIFNDVLKAEGVLMWSGCEKKI